MIAWGLVRGFNIIGLLKWQARKSWLSKVAVGNLQVFPKWETKPKILTYCSWGLGSGKKSYWFPLMCLRGYWLLGGLWTGFCLLISSLYLLLSQFFFKLYHRYAWKGNSIGYIGPRTICGFRRLIGVWNLFPTDKRIRVYLTTILTADLPTW